MINIPAKPTLVFSMLVSITIGQAALATPLTSRDQQPLSQFANFDDTNTETISHGNWGRVLGIMFEKKEDTNELVLDYGRLSRQGRQVLKTYLASMQDIEISRFSRKEQLAYWLNLYNAASFSLVIEALDSLAIQASSPSHNPHRKPTVRLKSLLTKDDGPWHALLYSVEGTRVSLADVEHRIVQAHWKDPRILYGLACSAKGCPALLAQPFTSAQLDAQLAAAGQMFIGDSSNVSVKRGQLKPSSIYVWHTNLLPDSQSILVHLRGMATDQLEASLAGVTKVKGESFSWKINGQVPKEGLSTTQGMFHRGAGATNY
jgi:hypothetical protein